MEMLWALDTRDWETLLAALCDLVAFVEWWSAHNLRLLIGYLHSRWLRLDLDTYTRPQGCDGWLPNRNNLAIISTVCWGPSWGWPNAYNDVGQIPLLRRWRSVVRSVGNFQVVVFVVVLLFYPVALHKTFSPLSLSPEIKAWGLNGMTSLGSRLLESMIPRCHLWLIWGLSPGDYKIRWNPGSSLLRLIACKAQFELGFKPQTIISGSALTTAVPDS